MFNSRGPYETIIEMGFCENTLGSVIRTNDFANYVLTLSEEKRKQHNPEPTNEQFYGGLIYLRNKIYLM